jgi:hypothetical protein
MTHPQQESEPPRQGAEGRAVLLHVASQPLHAWRGRQRGRANMQRLAPLSLHPELSRLGAQEEDL